MSKARVMVAALATAGLLALAGCGGNPQVAAYIGDVQLSQSKVDAVAQALADTSTDASDTAGSLKKTVMQIMVQGTLAAKVGAARQIEVTDAQRQAVYAQNELFTTLLKNPATTDFITTYANTATILGDDAGQSAYKDLLATTPIRVNPRYGTWDPATGGLADGSTGSLSEVAPAKG